VADEGGGRQAVGRGDVAESAVEPGGIIVIDELADDALGIVQGERGAVEALQLAVAPRVVGRGEDVGGLPEAD